MDEDAQLGSTIGNPKYTISVLVSTYNRSSMLKRAIEHLDACRVPHEVAVEVVVVDNNSSDDTAKVVKALQNSCGLKIIYVFEARQGLSYARNAGINASEGDLVAFTDDDCFANEDWFEALVQAFDENPDLAAVGGMVKLFDPKDLPMTIRLQETREFASESNLFSLIPGCNMCFRRNAVRKIGWFDVRFGAGTTLSSAEDSDYIYRGLRAGEAIEYIPTVCVRHAHGRQLPEDERKLARGYLIGRGAFYLKHVLRGDSRVLRLWFWETRGQLKHLLTGGAVGKVFWELGFLYYGALLYPAVSLHFRLQQRR